MTTTYYVVTLDFKNGPPAEEHRSAQRDFLAGLLEQGTLRAAGAFPDGGGGMSILNAASLDEAREIFSKSPLAGAGVDWGVREWAVAWGDL